MAEEIVQGVVWTDKAKISFNSVIKYLQTEWTDKEVENFVQSVNELISNIQFFPQMCKSSKRRKNVRIGLITKHTQMVYHHKPRKNQIVILFFWGTMQNPNRLKY